MSHKRELTKEAAQAQQLRYAIHSLERIAKGIDAPDKFAAVAIKHIIGPQTPTPNQELVDALDEALDLIDALNGRDNSCDPMVDISNLRAILKTAKQ
jgi:hypothetical protein